uniref:Nucleotide-diphospho-sugar transferase domain-containing protein n=1 Tax=Rhizophora mucronata TaxID=61149 RepID=A0A2P2IQD6_RHIMU
MYMEKSKQSVGNIAILALLFTGVLYLFIWSASLGSNPLLWEYRKRWSQDRCSNAQFRTIKFPIDELELALEKASMPNKTVIIAVVNKAYVDQTVESETTMLDLFLESFWLGENTRPLLDHLLLVAVDQTAYDRCMFKRLHCYKLETDGVEFAGEKLYMSKDFVKMMWRRTLLLIDVLKRGYSFVFTDTDVMWLRNPFSRLNKNESIDLQFSTDWFNGNPNSEKNSINTGFYHVRSNNRTISLFNAWYAEKDNSTGLKEQDVLLNLIRGGIIQRLGIHARFLDTLYFSGFCADSNDIRAVTTVHSNCCRSISAKITDLKAVLRDWKKFKASITNKNGVASNGTAPFSWTGHFGCWNSWNKT